jgi:ATP-dependent helicase/nuclease subunit A
VFIHRVLQRLPDLPPGDWSSYITVAVGRSGLPAGLAEDLTRLVADPLMTELLAGDGLSEIPLIARGPDGEPQRQRLDRLILSDSGILVADYKTDRTIPGRPEDCRPDYLAQMAAYRAALRQIHPLIPIRLALVWTEGPAIMLLPDNLLDRMAASRP